MCAGHGVRRRSTAEAAASVRGATNPICADEDDFEFSLITSSWPSWDSSPTTGKVGQNSRRALRMCRSMRLSASVCASCTYAPVTSSRPPLSFSPRSPESSTCLMMPSLSALRSRRSATRCGTLTLATGASVSACPTPYPRMSSEKDTDARGGPTGVRLVMPADRSELRGTADALLRARVWAGGTMARADESDRRMRAVTVWR